MRNLPPNLTIMRTVIEKFTIFNKSKEHPPRFPVRKISNNWVVDANDVVYETYEVNGEIIYRIKFDLLKF